MMATFRKAERRKAKLRLGISGPSGAGKTYSALMIASGMTNWDKIAVIDTENGSADLYAHLGGYGVLTLRPPYDPQKYVDAIKAAETEGFEVIIIDSLTHAWAGEGGLLEQVDKQAGATGNKFTAWAKITPKHNQLVESLLKSPAHIIATTRSKQEYILTEETNSMGKKVQVPKKVGMAPIQREGMEYEFTLFLDMSLDHTAFASKDRTGLFDGTYFKPTTETGHQLLQWLETGTEAPQPAAPSATEKELNNLAASGGAFNNPGDYPVNFSTYKGPLKEADRKTIEWIANDYSGKDAGVKQAARAYLETLYDAELAEATKNLGKETA